MRGRFFGDLKGRRGCGLCGSTDKTWIGWHVGAECRLWSVANGGMRSTFFGDLMGD